MTLDELKQLVDTLPEGFQGVLIPLQTTNNPAYWDTIRCVVMQAHFDLHGTRARACEAMGVATRTAQEWVRGLEFSYGNASAQRERGIPVLCHGHPSDETAVLT